MFPKYTLKMDLQPALKSENKEVGQFNAEQEVDSIIFDSDYTNLKKLQTELEEAVKSLNGRYAKKVFKFL